MSNTTPDDVRTEPAPEPTNYVGGDPARFGGRGALAAEEPRSLLETVGAVAAVLALVVGIPVLLLILAGVPSLPSEVPSMKSLAQQLSFEDLLHVLVAIVWITWAYFCVCLAVEAIAATRGGIARTMPMAGPMQRLARALIGAILLTGIIAGPANAATGPETAAPQNTVSSVTTVAGDAQAAVDTAVAVQQTQEGPQATASGHKTYTVKAPVNGYHDNLWDIAEKHLGDGRRYHEIFELNKDREMTNGGHLELARLIQPGWELVMPDDATGVTRAPVPAAATPATEGAQSGAQADSTADAAAEQVAADDGSQVPLGAGLLAAGLLAGLALRRRRQQGRTPDENGLVAESELMSFAAGTRAARLDQVLRQLAHVSRAAGTVPPPVYAAIVEDDAVELLLAPAVATTVEGWSSLDEGRRWRYEWTGDLDLDEPAQVPYPALVSLGVDDDGRDVLLDLEAAGGIVSISGDPDQLVQVATSIAVQAATAPWSHDVDVTATGLHHGLGELADDRLVVVDDLDASLDDFESRLESLRRDALTGRMGRRGVASHVVVCGTQPEGELAARLGALTGASRQALSVVVAGDHEAARWRLTVDADGVLTAGQLDLTLTASTISPSQVSALAELFEAADDESDDDGQVDFGVPSRRHDDVDWSTATWRVGVLGPVIVRGGTQVPTHGAAQVKEIVAYLALHPEGVHPTVLGGVVWPRGVTADVRDAAITRAREWLGTTSSGSYILREDAEGRLSLSQEAVCDWDVLRSMLLDARRAKSAPEQRDLLRRALTLVRGEAFSELPDGRYGWVALEGRRRTVVAAVREAAVRLCDLLEEEPHRAVEAAQVGLRAEPGNQDLWRRVMRARYAQDGTAGVQRTADEMTTVLHGVPLEAETEALFDEYVPQSAALPESG